MSYSDGLVESYDAHAAERDAKGEPAWRDAYRADFVARLPGSGRILELGAGVGYTSRWFADQGFDVVATDLSPENVARIRAKGLAAEVRDIRRLGLPARHFDGIWAASCLMHIADEDLPAALAGIAELLTDGGWFWAGTWGGRDEEGIWDADWYEPKRFYSFRSDDRMRSFYESHFEVASYEIIDPESDIEHHYQIALLRGRTDD